MKELEGLVHSQTNKLEEATANLFRRETQLEAFQPLNTRVEEYEQRINQLTKQLLLWESETLQFQALQAHHEDLELKLAEKDLMISTLTTKLAEARATATSHHATTSELTARISHHEAELAQQADAVTKTVRGNNSLYNGRFLGLMFSSENRGERQKKV